MGAAATLRVTLAGQNSHALDLGQDVMSIAAACALAFGDGVGASQIDRIWSDERTLAASDTEDLDLNAGNLLDPYGNVVTFAKLKAILVIADPGNTNTVEVTKPAANGVPIFLDDEGGIPVRPGGFFAEGAPGAGQVVTAGTGDLITVTNGGAGTPVTYKVVLLGTSA